MFVTMGMPGSSPWKTKTGVSNWTDGGLGVVVEIGMGVGVGEGTDVDVNVDVGIILGVDGAQAVTSIDISSMYSR